MNKRMISAVLSLALGGVSNAQAEEVKVERDWVIGSSCRQVDLLARSTMLSRQSGIPQKEMMSSHKDSPFWQYMITEAFGWDRYHSGSDQIDASRAFGKDMLLECQKLQQ